MNKTTLQARLSQLDNWIRDEDRRIVEQKGAVSALVKAGGATTVASGLLLHLERTQRLHIAQRRVVVDRLAQLPG
jgi:hypothetical protein